MSNQHYSFVLLILSCGVALTGCSSGAIKTIGGQVTVDGAPADTGTISFKPADNPTGRGIGGALTAGRFELPGSANLKPGKYLVSAQLSKLTGKTFNDPQKGKVPEIKMLNLVDSPQEIEISSDNSTELQLTFSTKSR
jgi:hypothetical protein